MMGIVTDLESQVESSLIRLGFAGQHATLVVAVSGGSDSLTLLYCLNRLRERHLINLQVCHLIHDFRGAEADNDAQFVIDVASTLGLPVTVEKRDPEEYQKERRISSYEEAARELRYTFLGAMADHLNATAIALGHTSDDLAETVLMHILRGTGLHGLRGMSELSTWPWPLQGRDFHLFRPLLQATKAETKAYCHELKYEYCDDTTNYLTNFTRNKVRHKLLPLLTTQYNPKVKTALIRLARTSAMQLQFMEKETEIAWAKVASVQSAAVTFKRDILEALHPALQRMLLRRSYVTLVGSSRRLREVHLASMTDFIDSASGRTLTLPLGIRFHSAYHNLVLCRAETLPCNYPLLNGDFPIALPALPGQRTITEIPGWRITTSIGSDEPVADNHLTTWITKSCIQNGVCIRTRRPADRFQPLGMTQHKTLRDFLSDAHVPRDWRDRIPLLVTNNDIAWVVGYRVAHWTRIFIGKHPITSTVQFSFQLTTS
jgi:tRNA(Ile)-lysidine synthase